MKYCFSVAARVFGLKAAVKLAVAGFLLGSVACSADEPASPAKETAKLPNIVVILADDLGYGDLGCYNAESKVPTPTLDALAKEGLSFTDMHTPSAVCTPTRYSLLTGRYAWRSDLKKGVLWGYSPLLIETDRETLPSMLQKQGYHTAGIGKWHLGMGRGEADFFKQPEDSDIPAEERFGGIRPGPNEVGFDYFYGIPASLDMKPYLYIEDGVAVEPVDGTLVKASGFRRDGGGGFWREGQIGKGFDFHTVLPVLTKKSVDYIAQRGKTKDQPFFLYFALTAPHTPWLATEEFQGKSGAGHYGDFVVQVDDVVRQIEEALDKAGVADDTILVFTSDNGAHWLSSDIKEYKHLANGSLRGQKADIWEGGHRVPLIARWPGHIPAAKSSDETATLTDLMATFAEITGAELSEGAAPDSYSVANALLGKDEPSAARPALIHHALDGMFAIRSGNWKLIEGLGSGGFTSPRRSKADKGEPNIQLYDLAADPAEQNNLAAKHPEVVDRLLQELKTIKLAGEN